MTPVKYDHAEPLMNGFGIVNAGGTFDEESGLFIGSKYSFVDRSGKEIAPLKYDKVETFQDGLACVSVGVRLTYSHHYEYQGKTHKQMQYEGGKYGFIDKHGNEIIPPQYNFAHGFSNGLASVCLNFRYGFIDKSGNEVVPIKYASTHGGFSDGLAGVEICTRKGLLYSFVDLQGNEVIPPKYDFAWFFMEGLAAVEIKPRTG